MLLVAALAGALLVAVGFPAPTGCLERAGAALTAAVLPVAVAADAIALFLAGAFFAALARAFFAALAGARFAAALAGAFFAAGGLVRGALAAAALTGAPRPLVAAAGR